MFHLYFLAAVFVLSGPLALLISFIAFRRCRRIQNQLDNLETNTSDSPTMDDKPVPASPPTRVEIGLKHTPPAPPLPAPVPAFETTSPKPTAQAKPDTSKAKPGPASGIGGFEALLGGKWLTWVGILALFFGTAFFLAVDLKQSALSGEPQILLGAAVGIIFLAIGRRLCANADSFLGLGLLGGGIALLFLAAFASYGFHNVVPLLVIFPVLLVVATLGAMLALKRNSLTIASMTLAGALLTPIILVSQATETWAMDALLPYLVAVNFGTVLVGLRRGWAGLPLAAFVSTMSIVHHWWDVQPQRNEWALLSVAGSWLVFAIAPWLQRQSNRFWSYARAMVLTANGLGFALFCHHFFALEGKMAQGALLILLAVIYYAQSVLMKKRRGANAATRLSYSTAAALVLVSIPIMLDLAWVTLGWTVLAGILIQAGLRERDVWHRISGLVVLALGLIRVVTVDIPDILVPTAKSTPILNGEFLTGLLTIGLMGWLCWAYHRYEDRLKAWELDLRSSLVVSAAVVLLWKLSGELGWLVSRHQMFNASYDRPTLWLWIFLLWSVYGLGVWSIGFRKSYIRLRQLGYGVLVVATIGAIGTGSSIGGNIVNGYHPILNLALIQGVVLTLVLALMSRIIHRRRDQFQTFEHNLSTPLLLAAIILLFVKVSYEVGMYFSWLSQALSQSQAFRNQLTLSLVWGLYSGVVIWIGFARRFRPLRLLGMSLLALTVLKVFLLDMQSLEQGYRIAAFIALGVLLLVISLLYQREKANKDAHEEKPNV